MLITIMQPDFIFKDERGMLTQLVHGGYSQINVITCKQNTSRGNHYHKSNLEAFYVVSGSFKLILESEGLTEEYEFSMGDFFSIKCNIKHSFYYYEDTILVSMYDVGVEMPNGEKDIYS